MRKGHYLLIGLIAIFAAGAAYFIANARSELTINDLEARLSALESQSTLQPSSGNRSRIVTPFQGSSNYEQDMSWEQKQRDRMERDRVNQQSRFQYEQDMRLDRLEWDSNELYRQNQREQFLRPNIWP